MRKKMNSNILVKMKRDTGGLWPPFKLDRLQRQTDDVPVRVGS